MIFHIWFYITSKKVKDFPNLWVNDFPRSMIIMVFNSRTIRKGSMAWIKKSKKCLLFEKISDISCSSILYKKYETREASHQKVSYHISRNRSSRYFFFRSNLPCGNCPGGPVTIRLLLGGGYYTGKYVVCYI